MNQRRSKYGAKPVIINGVRFDSKREAERWGILLLRERAGEIRDLSRQVRIPIVINGIKVCDYYADSSYVETATGEKVFEDVKGYLKNPVFLLKKKLVKACYGVDIRIVQ